MISSEVMKILVSGCGGFIGSCFSDWILANQSDVEIIGIDNFCTGFKENVDARVKLYEIDLVDHAAVDKVFDEHKFDYICHFAAFAAECLSPFVRRHTYTQNAIASTNLINNAINHGIKRFLFTSSIAVYGDIKPPFIETDIPTPVDIYGLSKYVTEQDLRIAYEQHGLQYTILRPFNITGSKQALNSLYRNVVGIFMNNLLDKKPLMIYGDGQQTRAFTFVQDILQPIWIALTDEAAANETYNLGASKQYSVKELADSLVEIAEGGQIQHSESRHEIRHAFCDVSKATKHLGFQEKTDFKTGIKEMWQWAKNYQRHPAEKFAKIEVEKGLYSFWK